MTVTRSCNPGDIAVDLKVSEGEYLLYLIPEADDNVQYVLTDKSGKVLLDNASCAPPCSRRWPKPGTEQPGGEDQHVLAMQFIHEDALKYKVEKHASDGTLIARIKDCRFENRGPPDDFFESLRIFAS